MKILAIGDFHGKFPLKLKNKLSKEDFDLVLGLGDYTGLPEWRPIIMMQLKVKKKGGDVLSTEEIIGKRRYTALLKKDYAAGRVVLKEIDRLNKPGFVLFGNGDWYRIFFNDVGKFYEDYVKKLRNIRQINRGKARFNGITFIGFGGYMDIDVYFTKKDPNFRKRVQRREESQRKLNKILFKTKGERIFLFHYPPKGVFDIIHGGKKNPMTGNSAGIGFFREALLRYRPKLALCGHMHEYQGAKKIGKTLVVNPGDAERGRYAIIDYPDGGKGKIKVKFVN